MKKIDRVILSGTKCSRRISSYLFFSVLLAFLAACDDSSSTSAENNEPTTLSSAEEQGSSSSSLVTSADSESLSSSSRRCEECNDEAISSSGNAELNGFSRFSSSEKKTESSSSEKLSETSSCSEDDDGYSSSSAILATPCKTETEDNCEYGTVLDDRDGQTYKTVKIGDQWWMAENLNYRYLGPTATLDSSSFCYGDDSANCTKYGRLYLWSAAMDSAGVIKGNTANGCGNASKCTPSGNVHGVCPQRWHLPSRDEWEVLFTTVGGWPTAGAKLKSTYGWNDYYGDRGNGDDAFGFSALSAGHRDNDGDYGSEGYYAYFWSSTEYDGDGAYYMYTNFSKDSAYYQSDIEKYEGFSVRCLKD